MRDTPIEAEFQRQLRQFQEEAVAKITGHEEGILCAPTAFGKTAVVAWLIAKRKVNTLVVVYDGDIHATRPVHFAATRTSLPSMAR